MCFSENPCLFTPLRRSRRSSWRSRKLAVDVREVFLPALPFRRVHGAGLRCQSIGACAVAMVSQDRERQGLFRVRKLRGLGVSLRAERQRPLQRRDRPFRVPLVEIGLPYLSRRRREERRLRAICLCRVSQRGGSRSRWRRPTREAGAELRRGLRRRSRRRGGSGREDAGAGRATAPRPPLLRPASLPS